MAGLRLLFLGAPIVERDGAAVLFDTRKAIALLAYLAVTGRPQRREALATLLWPEYEQANAYASLRRTLWSLKKGIGERRLLIDSETVALQPDGDLWLDVAAFRESLATSAGHAHPNTERCAVCLASLQAAAELYRDDFLAGFTLPDSPPFDEWHFFQTEGLRQELAGVLERLVTIYAARATPAEAIPHARRWLELDPLHEPAHRALIRLYLQAGQRAAALRQYESCVQRLAEELGAAPEPETTQLYQSILVNQLPARQQQPAPAEPPARAGGIAPTTLSGSTPPEPGTHSAKGRALPAQRTSFIGREREVEALCALFHRPDVRLVTLTGPGGSGKTRLAVEVARQIPDETSADSEQAFADGVFFVDLAPVGDPELVASTIAGALDVRPSGARPLQESLADFLRTRRLLLLLDNFEQVVAAAPLLAELLDAAPHLKLLVTSREILHLYGEWEFPVPPLAVPDPRQIPAGGDGLVRLLRDNEAARLFVERAWAANPGFTLNETNARAVAELCIRLEGLPLAIELAAARSKLFGPQALLARLAGRLDLLAGARDLPARQRTLRGAIQWSYDLLDPPEKLLFARLAVFVGGCTLEAAEQVAGYRSQVEGFPSTPEPSTSNLQPSTESSTFNLQPSAILNGIASLVDKSLLRREEGGDGEPRFTMLETIREFALERLGDRGASEVEALRWEHARYYLGLAEVAEPEIDHLTGADPGAWLARLEVEHDNLRAALDWSLVGGGADSAQLGLRLAGALRRFWIFRGFVREGRERLVALLAHQGAFARSTARAKALRAAGELAFLQGEYGAARTLVEEALALSRELGDKSGIARSLASLEGLRWQQGYAGEDSLNEEALALYRELGDKLQIAWTLIALAAEAWSRGDAARITALVEEALGIFYELGHIPGPAVALARLAGAARLRGDEEQARALYEEGLVLWRALGVKTGIFDLPIGLADVLYGQGDYARATALLEESLALARETEHRAGIAWSLRHLGTVAWLQGDYQRATALHKESLPLYQSLGDRWGITECLEGFAQIAARSGQQAQSLPYLERAARLFGAAQALREITGNPMVPPERARYEDGVAILRATLDEALLAPAWAEGRCMTVEQAVAYALAGE